MSPKRNTFPAGPGLVCLTFAPLLLLASSASARLPEKLPDLTPGEFQQGVIALVNLEGLYDRWFGTGRLELEAF